MRLKHLVKKLVAILLPVGPIMALNRALRALAAKTHHLQFVRQWHLASRTPHSFDTFIDLYWRWNATRNPMSWERGIFGLLAMKPGCRLLDVCCGEGFYIYHFYSGRAGSVIAMDYNSGAITHARRNFSAPNITYVQGDIRADMPNGPFDNISWDAGIEYFTRDEIGGILSAMKLRLAPDGILSGYSVLTAQDTAHQTPVAGQKFGAASSEALYAVLGQSFRNVTILRTEHADRFQERTNHYFFASDGLLPFGKGWHGLKQWAPASSEASKKHDDQ
jgi:ubiquinone/menaquinone biosynthesis C-methylase UbiE